MANAGTQRITKIERMIDAALDVNVAEQRYPKKRLSPSMFPICSVQEYAKQIFSKERGYMTGSAGTMLNIFAKAGTGMHESVQNALGNSKQLVGHWKCSHRGCEMYERAKDTYVNGKRKKGKYTRTRSTNNICPKCHKPMAYAELMILYKGLKGYVDGLIDNLDGTYSILDLKSTTVDKAGNDKFFVTYHRFQIMVYAYVMKKRYGYNVVDYTLAYVPRDNPKRFAIKTFKFDSKESKKAWKFLKMQLDAWASVMKSKETGEAAHAIEHKPCKTEDQYWQEFHAYDTCPFLNSCFIDSELTLRLQDLETKIKANPNLTYTEILDLRKKAPPQGFKKGKPQRVAVKMNQI